MTSQQGPAQHVEVHAGSEALPLVPTCDVKVQS
eukprot:CAMPEP_0206138568 /NCGR_PEP_ID=MMETSP1473-20131121/3413_1 /ASSEMBLY_ACC=CAM_ASM_001109 /TAXON_ID=1461547 /ORGANISM="Stichococcus sp, Strain RCC1054" /LENGTH=32 /DNA_ID= /DNA_START= /DNA_END= /DNA_ORIENTATION=